MGVDFFPCDYCGESICDCGRYTKCECGRRWCNMKCAGQDGFSQVEDGEWTCSFCRNEEFEDSTLLSFLLKRYDLTREQVVQEYQDELRRDDPPDAD